MIGARGSMLEVQGSRVSRANESLALSVVAPCFNEQESLPELLRRLCAVCQSCVATSFEIVLVDDSSTDDTCATLQAYLEVSPNIVGGEIITVTNLHYRPD